jgi:molybdopterin-guanine dinucleotide biosynthesis protein MobB
MRVFGIVGYKNSGKTTLTERLVAEIVARGLTVSTLKHAHHAVDIDQPGRDSFRHRQAGARQVVLASARRWALMTEVAGPEPGLADLVARLDPVDVVLAEGWKTAPIAKIEAVRAVNAHPLIAATDPMVVAVASDIPIATGCPCFALDDIPGIADFLLGEAFS